MDDTHRMNNYDFQVNLIMGREYLLHGLFQIGFMQHCWQSFNLKPLEEQVGPLHTQVFMSDMANQFAWTLEFFRISNTKQLFCTWHIGN